MIHASRMQDAARKVISSRPVNSLVIAYRNHLRETKLLQNLPEALLIRQPPADIVLARFFAALVNHRRRVMGASGHELCDYESAAAQVRRRNNCIKGTQRVD